MAEPIPPTQRQIAAQAGVSVSTVSLALRNHPNLPLETRQRVQQVAATMGYRTDPVMAEAMSHLRKGREANEHLPIALLHAFPTRLPIASDPVHHEFWTAAKARAAFLGYYLEEFWMREAGLRPERLRSVLDSRSIRGVILSQPLINQEGTVELRLEGLCAVNSGLCRFRPSLHAVASHHSQIMRVALQEVLARGYRRVGLAVPGELPALTAEDWEAVYHLWATLGRIPQALAVYRGPGDAAEVRAWIDCHRPDVVLGPGFLAQMIQEQFGERVGFAGLAISPSIDRCSGVDRRNADQAVALVDLLVAHLHRHEYGVPSFAKTVLIEGSWIDGGTLRPAVGKG